MESIQDMFSRGVEELLGRAAGPLHFRLFIMPIVVSFLARWAGLKDARQGHPAFLWSMFRNSADRPRLVRSAWKDVGKVFIVALVLDTAYQLIVLKAFFPGQTLFVAVACAIVPYILIRSPVGRFMRGYYRSLTPADHVTARRRMKSARQLEHQAQASSPHPIESQPVQERIES